MLSNDVLTTITEEVTQNVKKIFGNKLHKVILYGSYARGDAHDESDVDIIVLSDVKDEEIRSYKEAILDLTSDLGLEYNTLVSVVTENRQRFDDYLPILPFYQNVINDGVELYVNSK